MGTASGIKHAVTYLFPPVVKSGDMHNWMLGLTPAGSTAAASLFPWKYALWSAGYGLACVVVGLYLLRKVSLTKA